MRWLLPLAVWFVVSGSLPAAIAPANISGQILELSEGPGISVFEYEVRQLYLRSDGTYQGLLHRAYAGEFRQGIFMAAVRSAMLPPDGRWSYRVIGDRAAELVLDGRTVELEFSRPETGRCASGELRGGFFLEAYAPVSRLTNFSTRVYVSAGRSVSVGCSIAGVSRRVLIRVVGPGLRAFGVSDGLRNPTVVLRGADGRPLPEQLALFAGPMAARALLDAAAGRVGAFPLPSIDDIGVVEFIAAGSPLTIEVGAADGTSSGEVLVEVYELP